MLRCDVACAMLEYPKARIPVLLTPEGKEREGLGDGNSCREEARGLRPQENIYCRRANFRAQFSFLVSFPSEPPRARSLVRKACSPLALSPPIETTFSDRLR